MDATTVKRVESGRMFWSTLRSPDSVYCTFMAQLRSGIQFEPNPRRYPSRLMLQTVDPLAFPRPVLKITTPPGRPDPIVAADRLRPPSVTP